MTVTSMPFRQPCRRLPAGLTMARLVCLRASRGQTRGHERVFAKPSLRSSQHHYSRVARNLTASGELKRLLVPVQLKGLTFRVLLDAT